MNLILKRNPVWLECLPHPNASATLLLLGGDDQQVSVPVPLLLAASPVVRSILTDHLPPAYSPCCLSLPATTGDVLQVFRDILSTGAAAGAHEDKIQEIRQVFKMLGVEAWIVSCHLESIQVGQVLDRDIKQECLEEELEKIVKTEHIGDEDVDESKAFDHNQLNRKKKSSLFIKKSDIASAHGKIKIPCDLCPRRFIQKSHLFRHVKSVHDKIKFQCDLCPLKFSLKDSLLMHVKAIHDEIQVSCKLCKQKFTMKSSLKRHMESVHEKKEYSCILCPQKVSQKANLLRHIKSVHDKIEFPCNLVLRSSLWNQI